MRRQETYTGILEEAWEINQNTKNLTQINSRDFNKIRFEKWEKLKATHPKH